MDNKNFNKIINIKKEIDTNLLTLHSTLEDLKKIYTKLNENLNIESSYLGIDSLNFQIKIIDIKINNEKQLYILIKNRVYRDYYKFYKNIRKYMETNLDYSLKENSYPVYKELETNKEYEFENVIKIREEIEEYIKYLNKKIEDYKKKLIDFKNQKEKGLMCNNYILEEETRINILENKLLLYNNYLETHNNYHYIFLLNNLNDIKKILNVIQSDIKIKENEINEINEINKINKEAKKEDEEIENNKNIEKEEIENNKNIEKEEIENNKNIEKEEDEISINSNLDEEIFQDVDI